MTTRTITRTARKADKATTSDHRDRRDYDGLATLEAREDAERRLAYRDAWLEMVDRINDPRSDLD